VVGTIINRSGREPPISSKKDLKIHPIHSMKEIQLFGRLVVRTLVKILTFRVPKSALPAFEGAYPGSILSMK
jgi:hypothetical protein